MIGARGDYNKMYIFVYRPDRYAYNYGGLVAGGRGL